MENSKVIDDENLDNLRNYLSQFINGIVSGGTLAITVSEVSALLSIHKFTSSQFRKEYLKNISAK